MTNLTKSEVKGNSVYYTKNGLSPNAQVRILGSVPQERRKRILSYAKNIAGGKVITDTDVRAGEKLYYNPRNLASKATELYRKVKQK